MFKYFPHTEEDIKQMLDKIGLKHLNELFNPIPNEIQKRASLNLEEGLSEHALVRNMHLISNKNKHLQIFRGAGVYDHYIPSAISSLISRSEFMTSYTPYQPEISQGTLQYIFEFQSYICELTGMDVANASVYDGATATAEAMFMATSHTKKDKILVSKTVNPSVLEVVKTYAKFRNIKVVEVEEKEGRTSINDLQNHSDYAGLIVQQPNYYGLIESYEEIGQLVHENKGLFIMNSDPSILGVLKSPRDFGADIAVGEGQSLGLPLSFGGAYVGYMATTEALTRKMPGRICGITKDVHGNRAFVLTLQAREQHIRRAKANSNICSNQSLNALWVSIYLSLMGPSGLKAVNEQTYTNSHYLKEQLLKTKLFKPVHDDNFIKEFVLEANFDIKRAEEKLLDKGYLTGLNIKDNLVLFAVTEKYGKEDIDQFVEVLSNVIR